ncbi:hypothetical protein P7K49_014826, partial [Saguinus oedipus]
RHSSSAVDLLISAAGPAAARARRERAGRRRVTGGRAPRPPPCRWLRAPGPPPDWPGPAAPAAPSRAPRWVFPKSRGCGCGCDSASSLTPSCPASRRRRRPRPGPGPVVPPGGSRAKGRGSPRLAPLARAPRPAPREKALARPITAAPQMEPDLPLRAEPFPSHQ